MMFSEDGPRESDDLECPYCEVPVIRIEPGADTRWQCPRCGRVATQEEIDQEDEEFVALFQALFEDDEDESDSNDR